MNIYAYSNCTTLTPSNLHSTGWISSYKIENLSSRYWSILRRPLGFVSIETSEKKKKYRSSILYLVEMNNFRLEKKIFVHRKALPLITWSSRGVRLTRLEQRASKRGNKLYFKHDTRNVIQSEEICKAFVAGKFQRLICIWPKIQRSSRIASARVYIYILLIMWIDSRHYSYTKSSTVSRLTISPRWNVTCSQLVRDIMIVAYTNHSIDFREHEISYISTPPLYPSFNSGYQCTRVFEWGRFDQQLWNSIRI